MAERTKIGEGMERYMEKLESIKGMVELAQKETERLKGSLEEVYQGYATEEIRSFLEYLYSHLEKLCWLYEKMRQYISVTYETFYQRDREQARKIGTVGTSDAGVVPKP